VFDPWRVFQPGLMLVVGPGAYLVVEHLKVIGLTRLGWKGFPRANTLTYYEYSYFDQVENTCKGKTF